MPVFANAEEFMRDRSSTPRFVRSGQMVNCLRQDLLYSEKRARDILFAAAETVIRSAPRGSLIVARLTRDAAALAREDAGRAGFEFGNWDTAARAVVKALLSSGSLLGPGGHTIPFDVSAHAAPVGSLHTNYQDRVEAFLLEFLLRRLGDVTVRDHTALAHALFRQFDRSVPMEDLEDRVVILLARMADRVTLDGDTYVVCTN
jgi:hypothetical protein